MRAFAVFWIPVLVGLFSIIAIVMWPSHYASAPATPISFHALEDTQSSLTPEMALRQLRAGTTTAELWRETRRSEAPFWLYFQAPTADSGGVWIDFPSRQVTRIACWNAGNLAQAGAADRANHKGSMQPFRAGFALNPQADRHFLCQMQSVGAGRISVQSVHEADFLTKESAFHRTSGLLDGGILMLALFTAIAGLINRNTTYLLFAAWLLMNMRMTALSMGWDHQWLGQTIPPDWMGYIRPLTMAGYYVVSVSLFTSLFREELRRLGYAPLVAFAKWSCPPLLVMAIALPRATFLPILWVFTGVVGVCFLLMLGVILYKTRSKVAYWFAASIAVAFLASLYEIVASALGLKGLLGAVNIMTGALASSLLASLAIAEQMRQNHLQKLAAQEELQHTYAVIPIGLFCLDLQGRFVSVNPALSGMLGASPGELEHTSWAEQFHATSWQQVAERTRLNGTAEIEISIAQGRLAGKRFLAQATLAGDKIEGTLQDITEKAQATEHLKFLANHDPLTKVLNRRGIERMLSRGLAELDQGQVMAAAYLDLNRFKLINDLHGHAVGDAVLLTVCQRIQELLNERMFLGRVGGDEFLIVMTSTPLAHAELVCRGILYSVEVSPCQVDDRAFQVRCSIGLIEVTPGMLTKDVVSMADHACRMAKNGKSQGIVVFDRGSSVPSEYEAELQLIEQLTAQASIHGLYLEMQPIMSLRTPYGSLNFEVLLRMLDEFGKQVPTQRLIHAAENAGRMGIIDRWVVSHALEWLQKHQQDLPNLHFVCLNLSGASLNDERFIDDMLSLLETYQSVMSKVCLEITESVALHDTSNTRRFIDRVRGVGAKVALDDFGAGYTSFSYLKDLPADLLKIDGSFIVHMNRHPANIAIVEAIVSLAQNLGMKTIAEWAEDHETVATLAQIGVDYVQGFVVARPKKPEALLAVTSGADFILDAELKKYLSTMTQTADSQVGMVLGEEKNLPPSSTAHS